ncbi:hypothetical protein HDU93_005055 [Gonapodya sp. JEL0774]|nr:hypothetical protein HDU93_005055 [Gonapodya sp. JEL0774]
MVAMTGDSVAGPEVCTRSGDTFSEDTIAFDAEVVASVGSCIVEVTWSVSVVLNVEFCPRETACGGGGRMVGAEPLGDAAFPTGAGLTGAIEGGGGATAPAVPPETAAGGVDVPVDDGVGAGTFAGVEGEGDVGDVAGGGGEVGGGDGTTSVTGGGGGKAVGREDGGCAGGGLAGLGGGGGGVTATELVGAGGDAGGDAGGASGGGGAAGGEGGVPKPTCMPPKSILAIP